MLKSAGKAFLLSVLLGAWVGACGGGSFTSSGSGQDAGTDASAGTGGQTGGAGGTGTGGTAGTGGTGATGGTGGSAGADGGMGGVAATGGAGGSAGTGGAGGMGGTAGAGAMGGSGCPGFEYCQPSPATPPGCGTCAQYVCQTLPYCCQGPWDSSCALKAQTLGECQCPGLACSPQTFPTSSGGVCVDDNAYCNPLQTSQQCGSTSMQCGVNADSSQLHFQCTAIGTVPPCGACNPTTNQDCGPGLSCITGICVRMCCNDEDCGSEGVCAPGLLPGSYGGLGICRRP